jgi:hypothetical protein
MLRTTVNYVIIAAIAALLIGVSGCILNPADDKVPPPKPTYVYLDLTHKEDAIKNLVTAYEEHNISPIEKLLHAQYIWHNQEWDVTHGNVDREIVERGSEITSTTNIFLAADKRSEPTRYIDELKLEIKEGSWQQVSDFQGQPCDSCWQTTREYFITVVMEGGNTTLYGNDLVQFTIVPVMEDGKKLYKIGRADDLQKPSGL